MGSLFQVFWLDSERSFSAQRLLEMYLGAGRMWCVVDGNQKSGINSPVEVGTW